MQLLLNSYAISARFEHQEKKKGIIAATRCGSRSLRYHLCPAYKYETILDFYQTDPDMQFIGFVRDPWQRYISGLVQFVQQFAGVKVRKASNQGRFDKVFQSVFVDQVAKLVTLPYVNDQGVVFDEHTMPQYICFGAFADSQVELYRFETDYVTRAGEWVSDQPGICVSAHEGRSNPEFKKYMTERLSSDKEWMNRFHHIFRPDFELYDSLRIRKDDRFDQVLDSARIVED